MGDTWLIVVISLLLLLGSFFFVAAEYAMVSSRKSRLEALSRRGSRPAKALVKALDDISPYVAASQVGITMIGIGVGSVTEPFLSHAIANGLGGNLSEVGRRILHVFSFLLITFVLVVIGELVPKYLTLPMAEKMALRLFRPLGWATVVLTPISWLAQGAAKRIVRLFGIDTSKIGRGSVAKEEIMVLVQSGGAEGALDKMHADMVSRALRLDALAARDIMIHRLDIKWLDSDAPRDELRKKLNAIPFTRLPVCRGDIDEMIGIAYLHDIFRQWDAADFALDAVARPLVAIPENLTIEKIVASMRENKTQMLIVRDEYGGTSGLVTLEDVVEEVFGELEDRLESERKPIEGAVDGRISARAEVRVDELINHFHLRVDVGDQTDTLATIIVNALERVPRPGDSIETELGTLRVENMARRRITRVTVHLRPEILEKRAPES